VHDCQRRRAAPCRNVSESTVLLYRARRILVVTCIVSRCCVPHRDRRKSLAIIAGCTFFELAEGHDALLNTT
jgi:hypothetical protein